SEAAGARPVFRQEYAQPGSFLVGSPAPQDVHRHKVDIEAGIGQCGCNELSQRRANAPIHTITPKTGTTLEEQHGARRQWWLERLQGRWKTPLLTRSLEGNHIRDRHRSEHVANGTLALSDAPLRIVGEHVRTRPPRQRAAQHLQPDSIQSIEIRHETPGEPPFSGLVGCRALRSIASCAGSRRLRRRELCPLCPSALQKPYPRWAGHAS